MHQRADATKPNMGLTSWRGAQVKRSDVSIAKNYYTEDELGALNNLVEQYRVFAQGQASRRIPMKMGDWLRKLDGFLTLNDREILSSAGRVSHELAAEHAATEFQTFKQQKSAELESDFDRFAQRVIEEHREDE